MRKRAKAHRAWTEIRSFTTEVSPVRLRRSGTPQGKGRIADLRSAISLTRREWRAAGIPVMSRRSERAHPRATERKPRGSPTPAFSQRATQRRLVSEASVGASSSLAEPGPSSYYFQEATLPYPKQCTTSASPTSGRLRCEYGAITRGLIPAPPTACASSSSRASRNIPARGRRSPPARLGLGQSCSRRVGLPPTRQCHDFASLFCEHVDRRFRS